MNEDCRSVENYRAKQYLQKYKFLEIKFLKLEDWKKILKFLFL